LFSKQKSFVAYNFRVQSIAGSPIGHNLTPVYKK